MYNPGIKEVYPCITRVYRSILRYKPGSSPPKVGFPSAQRASPPKVGGFPLRREASLLRWVIPSAQSASLLPPVSLLDTSPYVSDSEINVSYEGRTRAIA